jgi:two-component system, response regulator YesN
MFNVLIVDDDLIDVEGLSQFVNWDELGYKVVGIAHSAKEAISIIETEYVDVVLTDIVMPGKNGLELIKDAHEANPYIKTVILSGYGEFEFAKEALRLGAFDYLMKPVNFTELKSIFNKLKVVLNNDILEKQKQVEFQSIRRTQFLNNLVNGFFHNIETINEKAFEIGLHLSKGSFCFVRLLLDEPTGISNKISENDFIKFKTGLSERTKAFFNKFGTAYLFDNNLREISVFFYPHNSNDVEKVLEKFVGFANVDESMKIYLGIGCTYDNVMRAPESYMEAGKALEYRYVKKDSLLYHKSIADFFKGRSVVTPEVEARIQDYLLIGDVKSLEEYIMRMLTDLNKIDRSDNGIVFDTCIEILLIINKCLSNYVDREKTFTPNDYNAIRTLLKKDNYNDIIGFISIYLRESMSMINANKEKPMGFAIENVIKYINEHYNENITLHKLSEIVYMHPTYLSKLFKEKTGESFIDYVMRVRIDQAKKLLENLSLRIYDVCEMVGYDGPKHFSKVFKDLTGSTPKEYRNQRSMSKSI